MKRRAPLVISGTLAGIVGLLSFHSKSATLHLNSLQPATSTSGGSPTGNQPGGTSSTTNGPSSTTNGPSSSTTSPSTAPPATTTPSPTTTPTTTGARSATGPVVNYYFGTVSVTVTANGKKITNISIASLNDGGNPRSQQIDQYALPQLQQQALSANSANIQGISGATYTSQGFAQSLQGALTKLGL